MSQAIVDPEELRAFAQEMTYFIEAVQDSMSRTQGRFAALGDTWRDREHEQFASEFETTMHVLTQFIATASDHVPFLYRKADAAQAYLDT